MARPNNHKIFAQQLVLLMREHKPPMLSRNGTPSATTLARFTGIGKQTLENYIKGRVRNIPASAVIRIANAFGVSMRWMLTDEGPRHRRTAMDNEVHHRRTIMDDELNQMLQMFSELKRAKSRTMLLNLAEILLATESKDKSS